MTGNDRVEVTGSEITTQGSTWAVRVVRVEESSLFGVLRGELPRRLRYVAITLDFTYFGSGQVELYPETVALVCFGSSPLQGLAQAPLLYLDEQTGQVAWLAERSGVLTVEANTPQHGTLVFEFHPDCREFRLYLPGCEGIPIRLEEMGGLKI